MFITALYFCQIKSHQSNDPVLYNQ